MFINQLKRFLQEESGQGITEYGAVLAFVSILIAITFGSKGILSTGISNAFAAVTNNINQIVAAGS